MPQHADGEFEVKLTPQPPDEKAGEPPLARMTLDKQFHGPLEASSKGLMIAAMTAVKGSAGYVAMEHVTGALAGKKGSFTLQHSGNMNRGEQQLTLTVVPNSGTGELAGLTGKMAIKIHSGKHFYEFEYTLTESR